jgi:transcription antitermination factor NusG
VTYAQHGEFGNARVAFAFSGQKIPPELAVEFELLRLSEKPPAMLVEWIKRLERFLDRAARPRPWSILRVSPGMERKVRDALGPKTRETPHGAGLSVYVPIEKYRPARTWKSRTRPLIPGYIFAELRDDDDLDLARANHAVRDVMARDGKPVRVDALCIGSMILAEAMGAFDSTWNAPRPGHPPGTPAARAKRKWEKGECARVTEGPFAGFIALIIAADRADRIETLVTIFGRVTALELDETMLEPFC